MKLTSRITSLPGWIYNLEVANEYTVDSNLTEGVNTMDHPIVKHLHAHFLTTPGLIIADCRMSYTEDTEDIFRVEGSNVMLTFGLSGSIQFEVDKLAPLHPATLSTHAISYTPNYDGRYLMSAGQHIKYVCIILSESFYFHLIDKQSNLHRDFVKHMANKEHAYFSPRPLAVTPAIKRVLTEITTVNPHSQVSRLILETKIKELLAIQLKEHLDNNHHQSDRLSPLPAYDEAKIIAAKHILDEQFVNPPSIAELAKIVALNEYKLKVGFKFHCHSTPYQYVIEKKMTMALALLKEGEYSISEVAYRVGYRDVAHFSNAFLKYFGHRPTALAQHL